VIDLLTTAVSVLADPPKNSGPDFGKASPLGLLVVVLLLIGVFVLVWSMNRHLKKLPKTFDEEPADGETADGETTDDGSEPTGDSEADAGRVPE
jgi:hypothetical protein